MTWCGLEGPLSAVVLGGRGGIGEAFVDALATSTAVDRVFATSRDARWCGARSEHPKVERLTLELTDERSFERLTDHPFFNPIWSSPGHHWVIAKWGRFECDDFSDCSPCSAEDIR